LPAPAPTEISTLSLHDALPIFRSLEDEARHVAYGVGRLRTQLASQREPDAVGQQFVEALESRLSFTYEVSGIPLPVQQALAVLRSEEHTSELQSPCNLVCRLLL